VGVGVKALESVCGVAPTSPPRLVRGYTDERSFLDYAHTNDLGERGVQVKVLRHITSLTN